MTRSEILQAAKPILFNTEMVRAILDGRKTVTRRVIKINFKDGESGYKIVRNTHTGEFCYLEVYDEWESEVRRIGLPYKLGDYLYVRETWRVLSAHRYEADARIVYRAGGSDLTIRFPFGNTDSINRDEYDRFIEKWYPNGNWHPSIHMPKEAARIFLRVTDMRVERLKDMTADSAMNEGFTDWNDVVRVWDSTIPPKDRDKYGWAANPYVWVVEFERVEVQE